jgi:hypothetical protein
MTVENKAEALLRILAEGGISPPDGGGEMVKGLDRELRAARTMYRSRKKMADEPRPDELNKAFIRKITSQSAALSRLIEENTTAIMNILDFGDRYEWLIQLSRHLSYLSMQGEIRMDKLRGGPTSERPVTTLFFALFKLYSKLKGTTKLGRGGPHYRFTKSCVEYLDLSVDMPNADGLHALIRSAQKRGDGMSGGKKFAIFT